MITAWTQTGSVTATDARPVPWWSFGKTVLAAAALVLVGQRRLHLDAPWPGHPFTLRQVLQHRAGIGCYGELAAYHTDVASGAAPWTVADLLSRAFRQPWEPGTTFAYSNVGYLLVRQAIERAMDQALQPALQQLVFGPLGIGGVTVASTPADLDQTAWGNVRRYHPGWVYHGLLVGPAAAAVSLLDGLLKGGLLPPVLLEAMMTAESVDGVVPGRPWRRTGYGLGLMIGEGDPRGWSIFQPNGSVRSECSSEQSIRAFLPSQSVRDVLYVGHTGGGPGSTAAVYAGPQGVAAAFAADEDQGNVEAAAMAYSGRRALIP